MEAFVYIWKDAGTGKLYVGYHKGSPDDGYICSSKPMLEEYSVRPQDFKRRILFQGTHEECVLREKSILCRYSAATSDRFYNKSNGSGYTPSDLLSELSTLMRERKGFREKMSQKHKDRWTTDERAKQSARLKESISKLSEDERIAKYGDFHRGRPKPNIDNYRIGAQRRIADPEFSNRLSEACKGKRKQKTCPHCGLVGAGGNMTRYHFDNCKEKDVY